MLTVATYNIHRCVGSDSIYRPSRIVAVIRELNADILGLQEVDQHVMHVEGHQLDYIAAATGYKFVAGPTMLQEEAEFGNAILSRYPIMASDRHNLTVPGREPRGALEAVVDVRGTMVRVICTHLGLKLRERVAQVSLLCKLVQDTPRGPVVLLGDFNEWLPWLGSTRKLDSRLQRGERRKTFPSHHPLFDLDRIYANRPLGTAVLRTRLTEKASDHLPLTGMLSL